ncbi:MAG: ABC transporter ATP-binding protein, partial [Pseudomonadales bacterium]|nr:ABC transporter ATP-binding protein [Pseudomonadales bacterium]
EKSGIRATHILEEVMAVCSRAMIISGGRMMADCHPTELEAQSRYHGAVTVQLEDASDTARLAERLASLASVGDVERSGDDLEITAFPVEPGRPVFTEISDLLAGHDWKVKGVFQEKGRLDEVFRRITEGRAA